MPELLQIQSIEDTAGAQPDPITGAILKVHSRCNLDCDYCYVYNLGDSSYLEQPRLMSTDTVQAAGARIGEYLESAPLHSFGITLHGGEPLLAPPEWYEEAIPILRKFAPASKYLEMTIQTNGTLLTDRHLEVFRRQGVRVGVSLDGGREAQDHHRLDRGGRSTYDAALRGIERMTSSPRYQKLFAGILAVIDTQNDPAETYHALRNTLAPSIDFLLPHGNWHAQPAGLADRTLSSLGDPEAWEHTPYGKWYAGVFDEWYPLDRQWVRIGTFDSILRLIRGKSSLVESIGGAAADTVVIETNGTYELVDTLNATPGRKAYTGMSVYRHGLEQASAYMQRKARAMGATALSEQCMQCPVVGQCGGGYIAHRSGPEAEPGKEFTHPSVYCPDLAYTIAHVYGTVRKDALFHRSWQAARTV
jgi:uncharacterized protein